MSFFCSFSALFVSSYRARLFRLKMLQKTDENCGDYHPFFVAVAHENPIGHQKRLTHAQVLTILIVCGVQLSIRIGDRNDFCACLLGFNAKGVARHNRQIDRLALFCELDRLASKDGILPRAIMRGFDLDDNRRVGGFHTQEGVVPEKCVANDVF